MVRIPFQYPTDKHINLIAVETKFLAKYARKARTREEQDGCDRGEICLQMKNLVEISLAFYEQHLEVMLKR